MKLEELNYDILKKSIDIYLEIAYEKEIHNDSFNYALYEKVMQKNNYEDLFSLFKVEEPEKGKIRYSLQLGSEKYPFLKLVLLRYLNSDNYGFLVDRHTEYLSTKTDSVDFKREKEIKDFTKKVKLEIEEVWEQNNIPTYRNIVRDLTEKQSREIDTMSIEKLGHTVLLAEDDPDIANLHKTQIELLGYDVIVAYNGEQAIELMEKQEFACMVLDLMMPTISGFEIIEIYSDEIPIVVLSAISDQLSINKCLDAGAEAFLIKPVENTLLEKTLLNVISKHQ